MLTLNASRTPRLVIAAVLLLPLLVSGCWFAAAGGVAAAGGGGGGGGDGVVNLAPSASLADPGRLDQPEEQLTFTVADGNNDLVDLDVSFQLQGSGVTPATLTGATVATASPITTGGTGTVAPAAITIENGNVVTGIPATAAGVEVVVTWALGTDVNLNVASPGPSLIFGVTDGKVAVEPVVQQDDGSIIGNDAPTVDKVTTSGNTGNIVVSAEVADSTDDEIDLIVEFSTDNFVADIRSATIVVGATESLAAPITSTTHTVSWGSDSDLNLVNLANISIRVRALDATAEGSSESAALSVINNQPPTVALGNLNTRLPGSPTGDIAIPLTLANAEENAEAISVGIEFSTDDFAADIRSATILQSTTGLITSVTGTNFNFTWDTDTDLGANALGGVRLRFKPTDTFQTGSTVVSPFLDVLNDAPTVTIQNPPVTDATGNPLPSVGQVPLAFLLVDSSTGDPSSISVEFSTDNFASDIRSATILGSTNGLPGAPGGIPHGVAWDSLADVGFVNLSAAFLRISATDVFGAQSALDTTSFELLNNTGPIVDIDIVVRQDGDFIINYTLSDQQGDNVDVDVKFNLDDGSQFSATPAASNVEGVTGLSSSQFGESHVFVWDSATDLGAGATTGVTIVITPSDAQSTGQSDLSNAFTVGNDAPVIQNIVTPTGDQTGNIAIQFELADTTADSVDLINVEFSTDDFATVANIRSATLIGGNPNALATTATGLQQTVVWISDGLNQLPGERQETVKMRFQVRDAASVPGAEDSIQVATGTFVVDNNATPRVVITEISLNPDNVGGHVVEFLAFDDDSDFIDAVLQWRLSDDAFPALDATFDDPQSRSLALQDADERRTLQILSEEQVDLLGQVDAASGTVPADQVPVSSQLATGQLTDSVFLGKRFQALRPSVPSALGSTLNTPGPLAVEPSGTAVLVGEQGNNRLVRVALTDGTTTTVANGLGTPTAIAIEPDGKNALVTDSAGGSLIRVDLGNGASQTIINGTLTSPQGIALISSLQALVTEGDGSIALVDLEQDTSATITAAFTDPRGIVTFDQGRRALVADNATNEILELNVLTHVVSVFSTSVTAPEQLTLAPGGRDLLVTTSTGDVFKLNLGTGSVGSLASGVTPGGAAEAPDGSILFSDAIAAGNVFVRNGVAQERTVTAVSVSPARLTVDSAFNPALTPGTRWRLLRAGNRGDDPLRSVLGLEASPTGVRHRFVWNSSLDDTPQRDSQIGITPFDLKRGDIDVAQVGQTFVRVDEASPILRSSGLEVANPVNPEAAATGDLDGNGTTDIVTVNALGRVMVYLQSTPGQISATPDFDLNTGFSNIHRVALADLNGDDDLDIVTANETSDNVTVFFQSPPGQFDAGADITLSSAAGDMEGPFGLALGDVNGDGLTDIATANISTPLGGGELGNVTVFLATGVGAFEAEPSINVSTTDLGLGLTASGNTPRSLTLADMDGDGDLDIVLGEHENSGSGVIILLQNAVGVFDPADAVVVNGGGLGRCEFITVGDIDGDGLLDVAAGGVGGAVVLTQTGGLAFTLAELFDSNELGLLFPEAIDIADIDDDGLMEVAVGYRGNEMAVVYRQSSPGVFLQEPIVRTAKGGDSPTIFVSFAEVDGDGDTDLLLAFGGGGFGIISAFPLTSLALPSTTPTVLGTDSVEGIEPAAVVVADMDADGDLDVAYANQNPGTLSVIHQLSPGKFEASPATDLNAEFLNQSIAAGDVDGDGDVDLLTGERFSFGAVELHRQTSPGVFTATRLDPAGNGLISDVHIVDINGDDLPDLIALDFTTDDVKIFLQATDGSFSSTPSVTLTDGTMDTPLEAAIGDLDGDGDLDIVTANNVSDDLSVFLQGPAGSFTAAAPIAPGDTAVMDGPVSVAIADIDGDGIQDVIAANTAGSPVTIFLQKAGSFDANLGTAEIDPAQQLTPNTVSPLKMRLGDMDGDGDLDIVLAHQSTTGITITRQTAPGQFDASAFITLTSASMDSPAGLALADIDGDGSLDIVTANKASDNLTIFSANSR